MKYITLLPFVFLSGSLFAANPHVNVSIETGLSHASFRMSDNIQTPIETDEIRNRVSNVAMPLTLRAGFSLPQYSMTPTIAYTHYFGSSSGLKVYEDNAIILRETSEPDNLLSLQMRFEHPTYNKNIRWFGELGPAYLWQTSKYFSDNSPDPNIDKSFKNTHFGVHIGIGSIYQINPKIDLTQEITYYRFRSRSNVVQSDPALQATETFSQRPSLLNATIGITYHIS